MSITENSAALHDRTITAFFNDRAHAEKAKADTIQAGIDSSMTTIVEGHDATSSVAATTHEVGFWESVKEMFMPEDDKHAYAEGLRRGGFLLTAHTDATNYDRILHILDADGAADMDTMESQWRSEGWDGRSVAAVETGTSTAAVGTAPVAARADVRSGVGETLERVEETLRVGKRDVNHGRVRLRSYVVETPVHESVQLRSENVEITRRPVDRALGVSEAAFQERTIEAEEHEEVAVISKEARVIEEISLGKTVQDRAHEINDTVRRTEVEIDDGRTGASGPAAGNRRFALEDAATLIREHMDVIGSDGSKIGTVDHLDTGDRIKLAKTTSPDGQHHFIPLAWIDHVDQHVHLSKTADQARTGWN